MTDKTDKTDQNWNGFTTGSIAKGDLLRAYEEGRASAMQGTSAEDCPYFRRTEAAHYAAWLKGHMSFTGSK